MGARKKSNKYHNMDPENPGIWLDAPAYADGPEVCKRHGCLFVTYEHPHNGDEYTRCPECYREAVDGSRGLDWMG